MANKEQIDMLLIKSKLAGIAATWEDFVGLDNGQITAKKNELVNIAQGKEHAADFGETKKSNVFDDKRFHLCCIQVITECLMKRCIENRAQFASDVLSLYVSVVYAEAVVKEKLPSLVTDIVTAE